MGNYIDVTFADSYIGINPLVKSKWLAYTPTEKGEYIDYVEQQIDNINWIDEKYSDTQVGAFPRDLTEVINSDNYNFLNDLDKARYAEFNGVIPTLLQNAVCEFIIYIIRTQCFDDFTAQGEIQINSWESGSLNVGKDLNQRLMTMPSQKVRQILGFMTYPGFERLSVRLVGRA